MSARFSSPTDLYGEIAAVIDVELRVKARRERRLIHGRAREPRPVIADLGESAFDRAVQLLHRLEPIRRILREAAHHECIDRGRNRRIELARR